MMVGAADPEQSKLDAIFETCGWRLARAQTPLEARKFLETTPVRVVIAESDLPGGGWRQMLEDLRQSANPPLLLVTARLADESLWAEVLNMGGYDVLAKPLDAEEVARVVSAAMRHFDNERRRPQPKSAAPLIVAAAS